ncbi:MAG: hypothetical protein WCF22_14290 [Candidatus Sulfotelmatobacter sp.]
MSMEKVRWFLLGVPTLVLIGIGIAVGVHVALGRSWSELLLPVGAYVAMEVGVYVCMYWARNRARTRQDYGPAVALVGAYAWGTGLLVIYYGTRWRVIGNHGTNDLLGFSVFMIVVVVITFALFFLFKGRLKSQG